MTGVALIFASTFVAVFTLGLQSRLVNTENYAGAAVNSLFISAGHIALYKVMPESGGIEILGYFAGGVLGITASIWFHKRASAWWQARSIIRHGPPRPAPECRPRPCGYPGDEHADVQHAGCTRSFNDLRCLSRGCTDTALWDSSYCLKHRPY